MGPELVDLVEAERARCPLASTAQAGARAVEHWRRAGGLGPLEPVLADPSVGEIMVNASGEVWVDRGDRAEPTGIRIEPDDLALVIERILDPLGLRVDPSHPRADARLADGSRVNVVVPPLALDGPVVTVRRFPHRSVTLDHFGGPSLVAVLTRLVAERRTLLIVGGTSTGKTSLINALGQLLDPEERVVTIEDVAELRLGGRHVVRLEARPANSEGVGETTIGDLVVNALRMRPDRLVVGEVRGPEALDLILGLNTGHAGSLATCHAGGARAALDRLATLATLAAPGLAADGLAAQVATAIDVVVTVERRGQRRLVSQITEVGPPPEVPLRTLWSLDGILSPDLDLDLDLEPGAGAGAGAGGQR